MLLKVLQEQVKAATQLANSKVVGVAVLLAEAATQQLHHPRLYLR
jgi:hypothetical protein